MLQKYCQLLWSLPALKAFVDSLYALPGTTNVKLSDGEWEAIKVCEGFSQGCPLSPILAAIVLNYILKKVDAKLRAKANTRKKSTSDDGLGGLAIILAYVDDANFLVPLEDVELLLTTFNEVALPLGAVMNTEKTRIMTSTTNQSILPALAKANPTVQASLLRAIQQFSRKKDDTGEYTPYEETSGLRILGVPVGSPTYCKQFIMSKLESAKSDASKIINRLNDKQTKLRIFKTCTLHKMTHLFASDVLSSNLTNLPDD